MRKKIFMLALMSTGFVMILFSRLTLVQKGFRYEELSRKETVKEPSKEKFKGAVKKELKETSKNELSAETARAAIKSEVPGTHVVLYYTSWWPDHGTGGTWDLGEGSSMFSHCPHNNCLLTANRSLLPSIASYSALLFHSWKMFAKDVPIPASRSLRQKYILFSIEPQTHCAYLTPWEETVLAGFFNSTSSFRSDSDLPAPYGRVLPRHSSTVEELRRRHRLRSGRDREELGSWREKVWPVLWMASHCWTDSGREDYVAELHKYMEVRVQGKCAQTLGQNSTDDTDLTKYYFYLAFENSKCKDYITEKFFRGLQAPVIPVVLGGADYAAVAPPHSYIDVRDFPSPRHLAEYLQHLISHPAEYLDYFWWKPHYQVIFEVDPLSRRGLLPASFPCTLCHHLATSKPGHIDNLAQVWREEAGCEEKSTFHCNRDREAWYPGRKIYTDQLSKLNKTRVVQLQHMVD